jgi:Domain of unknown function (DUF4267)
MTYTHVIEIIAAVLGVAVVAMGAGYVIAPARSAPGFGVPAWPSGEALAWLNIKGMRDIVTGLLVLVLLLTATPHVVAVYLLTIALIPLGDAAIVLAHKGNKALAYGMHGGTAAGVIAVGLLLLV